MEDEIIDKLGQLIDPFLKAEGVELVESVYRRERSSMVLRILVDKEGGINLGECSALNKKISQALDESIFMDESYVLEVSSPGLTRPLQSPSDFRRAMGKRVKVVLDDNIEGSQVWIGDVVEVNHKNVVIKVGDKKIEIPLDKIVRAKKEVVF